MDCAKSTFPSRPAAGTEISANHSARECLLPAIFVLFALAVLLPNVFVLEASQLYPIASDSAEYDAAAVGIAHFVDELSSALPKLSSGDFTPEERLRYGWGNGILQHAAGYVVPLGITYAWFGHSETAGRLLTALMVALTTGLLVLWTRARFGRFAAVVAGLAFIFWPAHIRFGTAIMTEMPMVFWILLAVVGLEWSRRTTGLLTLLGGALLACGILVKVSLQYLIVPLLLVDLLERGGPGRFRFVAWRAAGVLAVFALWTGFLRGADLPAGGAVSGYESALLFRGNVPEDRGFESVGLGEAFVPALLDALRANPDPTGVEDAGDRMARIHSQALAETIREEPSRWAGLVLAKAGWFWRWPGVAYDVPSWFGSLPPPSRLQILTVAAGLLGLGLTFVRGGGGLLPAVLFAYLTALHAGTHLVSRYNIPGLALLLPYAGGGCAWLVFTLCRLVRGAGWTSPAKATGEKEGVGERVRSRKEQAKGGRDGVVLRRGGAPIWGSLSVTERTAFLAALGFFVLTLALSRDVWVALGLPLASAHGAHELTRFGVFLASGVLLFLRIRATGIRPIRAAAAGLLPVLWGLAMLGDAQADRDGDSWGARLSRPGDRIVQTLRLPEDIDWTVFRHAEVFVDMMEDAGTHPEVVVRLNGVTARRFAEGLANPDEDYLLDRAAHAVQNRYRRVEEAYRAKLDDYVLRRYPDADFSYFRQWFRIPVGVGSLEATPEVVIEIELVDPRGGGVTVFGDAEIEGPQTGTGQTRRVGAPAFLENPYELSTYQFALFATDRIRADVRFIRPLGLYSTRAQGEFIRDGRSLGNDLSPARGLQRGEYRIRLRTQLHGGYVHRQSGDQTDPTWEVWPSANDLPIPASELRALCARRDQFFGGWFSY